MLSRCNVNGNFPAIILAWNWKLVMSVYHQFLWTTIKQKDHMFYKHYRIMSSTAMVSPWFCFSSSKRSRRCCLYVNPYQNKWSIAYRLLTKFRQYSWFMVTKNFAFDCSWKYENISKQIILRPKRAYKKSILDLGFSERAPKRSRYTSFHTKWDSTLRQYKFQLLRNLLTENHNNMSNLIYRLLLSCLFIFHMTTSI